MPRREIKIKTVSYVHVGDRLVDTRELDPEQRRRLANWIECTGRNALFEGRAAFYPEDEAARAAYFADRDRTQAHCAAMVREGKKR